MSTTLTPSVEQTERPSEGQIGKLCDRVAAAARKSGISDKRFQVALKEPGTELEEKIVAVLKQFANKVSPTFDTWKTINLGTHKTVKKLETAITNAGDKISNWANDILGKPDFTISPEETTIDLVRVSIRQLGFPEGAKFKDIYARALEIGLELCPSEVGPQLRLQYNDQPCGEWIVVAMEPVTGSDGDPDLFIVRRRGGGTSWLLTFYDVPGSVWSSDDVFVFARRKKN